MYLSQLVALANTLDPTSPHPTSFPANGSLASREGSPKQKPQQQQQPPNAVAEASGPSCLARCLLVMSLADVMTAALLRRGKSSFELAMNDPVFIFEIYVYFGAM
jgi:hypothetical protein